MSATGFESNTLEKSDFNGWMEDFFNTSVFGFSTLPEVEIRETPAAYLMEVDIGDLGREEVQITLEGNLFTIASHNPARTLKRSFVIPADVRKGGIREGFENGKLRLRFPRKTARKS